MGKTSIKKKQSGIPQLTILHMDTQIRKDFSSTHK